MADKTYQVTYRDGSGIRIRAERYRRDSGNVKFISGDNEIVGEIKESEIRAIVDTAAEHHPSPRNIAQMRGTGKDSDKE